MATPDGISDSDWKRVEELAFAIAKHHDDSRHQLCLKAFFDYLDKLQLKYGELPSILASRADFMDDDSAREPVLLRAYDLATRRKDHKNALHISHSLVELYAEHPKKVTEARQLLAKMRKHLNKEPDPWFEEEWRRLRRMLYRST